MSWIIVHMTVSSGMKLWSTSHQCSDFLQLSVCSVYVWLARNVVCACTCVLLLTVAVNIGLIIFFRSLCTVLHCYSVKLLDSSVCCCNSCVCEIHPRHIYTTTHTVRSAVDCGIKQTRIFQTNSCCYLWQAIIFLPCGFYLLLSFSFLA